MQQFYIKINAFMVAATVVYLCKSNIVKNETSPLMLRLISSLLNRPVLSLQTSSPVATTIGAIIDPNKLQIVGFHVQSPSDTGTILLRDDIREISNIGIIIDRYDRLAHAEELVRLEKIIKLNYKLIDKTVIGESKHKYGKVSDYIVDEQSFFVAKLYTRQSLLKNFAGGAMVVDRSQIVEVTNKNVVIRDPLKGVESSAATAVAGG
jgi:uncharacterized protein YrrD